MKSIGYHKNIVNMLACVTIKKPFRLVVECMEEGDLRNFLKKIKDRVKSSCDMCYVMLFFVEGYANEIIEHYSSLKSTELF